MEILATKPYSAHPDDAHLSIKLYRNHKGEYVTSMCNELAMFDGHYFKSYDAALNDFNKRPEV